MANWAVILAVAGLGSRTTVQLEYDAAKVCMHLHLPVYDIYVMSKQQFLQILTAQAPRLNGAINSEIMCAYVCAVVVMLLA